MKWLAAALASLTLAAPLRSANACGCFAPPSPMTPVVQAGERILFMHDGSQVTAYIQIQYQGAAAEFGWLVPLPSVPTLEVGTDELFTTLQAQTNPQYSITTQRNFCGGGSSRSSGIGCGASDSAGSAAAADAGVFAASDMGASNPGGPLVLKASIGPYDYAVLKADDQQEMLSWLNTNRYFVPDATGAAVAPYIHPGGFFLALKLRAGESAGDVVPIVLRYASDLPMIPITLTSVGAIPDMGVLVWLLGDARAIPRNYNHVVLDEMPIWENLLDYPRLVVKAIHEAPNRHAFVTEYAGTSSVMANQLDYPGRFGNPDQLRLITNPGQYLSILRSDGYTFDATLFAILEKYLPEPAQLVASGITEFQYYMSFDYYQSSIGGDPDAGTPLDTFDPVALTDELQTRIVVPTRAAAQLFTKWPYLTRLYTALSPEDMNLDPVFSENPDLPDVARQHNATLTVPCSGDAWLRTDTGLEEQWVSSLPPNKSWPGAAKIERLREGGAPDVITDNTAVIAGKLGSVDHGHDSSSGCEVQRRIPSGALGTFALVALAIAIARRRRRA
jgi:hypothetical protein